MLYHITWCSVVFYNTTLSDNIVLHSNKLNCVILYYVVPWYNILDYITSNHYTSYFTNQSYQFSLPSVPVFMFHILIVWSLEELAKRVQEGSACKGSKLSAVTCMYGRMRARTMRRREIKTYSAYSDMLFQNSWDYYSNTFNTMESMQKRKACKNKILQSELLIRVRSYPFFMTPQGLPFLNAGFWIPNTDFSRSTD